MPNPIIQLAGTEINVSCGVLAQLRMSITAHVRGNFHLCMQFRSAELGGASIPCSFIDENGNHVPSICKGINIAIIDTAQAATFDFRVACNRTGTFHGFLDINVTDSARGHGSASIRIHINC